jgi:sugar phosphate isomerase/epimerase
MRYAFNSYNTSVALGELPCLPEVITAAAAAGYDGVGLDLPSAGAHARSGLGPGELAALLDDAGLPCLELAFVRISPDRAGTDAAVDEALPWVDALRPEHLQVIVDGDDLAASTRNLARVAAALRGTPTRVALEFVPMLSVRTLSEALAVLDAAGDESAGVCLDTWHLFHGADPWDELARLPLDRLGYVQFTDAAPPESADLRTESLHRRVAPGEGVLPLGEFATVLVDRGFDGLVSVEVLSQALRNADLPRTAVDLLAATRAVWTAADARGAGP